jgi:hypothetical protein
MCINIFLLYLDGSLDPGKVRTPRQLSTLPRRKFGTVFCHTHITQSYLIIVISIKLKLFKTLSTSILICQINICIIYTFLITNERHLQSNYTAAAYTFQRLLNLFKSLTI